MKRILQFACMLMLGVAARAQVVVNTTVACATSVDGSVVGVPNPLNPPIVAAGFSGTLPAGNYYVQIAWYDAAGHVTLVGPEVPRQLTGTGRLTINLPSSGKPSTAVGMNVYIGSASGAETLQGQTSGAATFTQSTPLTAGAAKPTVNNTVCAIVANDAGWPTGTGYAVSMTTPAGDTMPGYPMQWQLLGPGTTINLSNGLPMYNGTVTYPIPILARPYNHTSQSISGPLSMGNYNVVAIGSLGVGTSTPGWPIDVESGAINASGGYIINGGAGIVTGQCLVAGSDPFHTFNATTPCIGSIPTVYYQRVGFNSTSLPQEPAVNFVGPFTVADSTTPAQTNVGVNTTGSEVKLVTATAPGTSTHCAQWNAAGGIGDSGSTCAGPSTTTTCTGTTPPWGCYRVEADGTIEEWGVSAAVPTSADQNVVGITFPLAFTSTGNLSFVAMSDGCVDTCGGTTPKNPVAFSQVQGTLTASGVTVSFTGVTPTGGGGGVLTATIHAHWHATGFH